jgi:hypothetical protein
VSGHQDPAHHWWSPPSRHRTQPGRPEERSETHWWQETGRHAPTPPPVAPPQYGPRPPTISEAGTPQYPQPYGHGQPAQPGESASATTSGKGSKGKGSKGKVVLIVAIIGAVFALIIGVVLVLTLTGSGSDKPNKVVKLKVSSVQDRVLQILKDPVSGYGGDEIKDVKCNKGQDPTVKKGDSFTCEVSVRGKKRQVTVTIQDDNGTYLVGLPQEGGK